MGTGMDKGLGFALVPIFVIVSLACTGQATASVSSPESRFVWEPGENLAFTWTPENFDGFYYDPENRAGNETLTIRLDNIKDRSIPKDGIEYSTTVAIATARYRQFGKYAVIGFIGEKYLAGYPEGRSDISNFGGINLKSLHKILLDESAIHKLAIGSDLTVGDGYVLKITDIKVRSASVTLSLLKDGIRLDTKIINAGNNYIYILLGRPLITVHIDSVLEENETDSVTINGIFQVSEYNMPVNEGDIFGVMKITKISDSGITMRNTVFPVNLEPGSIIEIIYGIKLKVADSNNLRVQLFYDGNDEKSEHRGACGSNNRTAWDGLNYAGFWYDIDSGNYSESLEIKNMTDRIIPPGGLTYTSYRIQVPYAVTKMTGKKPPGTNGTYFAYSLGGNKYAVRNNGLAKIIVEQERGVYEKKTFSEIETWELGEGYTLNAPYINTFSPQWDAQIILKRNGVELQNIKLLPQNIYTHGGGDNAPIFITYLDAVFSGNSFNVIQLKYTWLVSSNITEIKKGDRFGVFNVTDVEPDRMVLKNRIPIDLKAGSSVNLLGNLSFFVENSDELRFYPTNVGGTQVIPGEVIENAVQETPDITTQAGASPVAGGTERIPGFEAVLVMMILLAVYTVRRKDR